MKPYIQKIHINNLYHLHDLDINVPDERSPHIIITGKNGSGKTVLLNALADYLDKIKKDCNFNFLNYEKNRDFYLQQAARETDAIKKKRFQQDADRYVQRIADLKGKVDIEFEDVTEIIEKYGNNEFVIAFYPAERKNLITQPLNPKKPELIIKNVRDSLISQLLFFLSDLKFQEALARNEGKIKDADILKEWYLKFQKVLRSIFDDKNLELEFIYQDYSFLIHTEGNTFNITQMSDGFRAILEIVADLILKMQTGGSLTSEFNKPGIVLIDEIETHLHLQLQKNVLPLLTTLFPNIQFIVTTHSPFVLSSQENAIAYDMEHQQVVDDLTDYSYEALAEGYFDVKSDSSYVNARLKELETLLAKDRKTELEKAKMDKLISDFEAIPEPILPRIKGRFNQIMMLYAN